MMIKYWMKYAFSFLKDLNPYTGEDVIEISAHVRHLFSNKLLIPVLIRCPVAKPGEFTQRAFLKGKMDLTQAEAVADLHCI
jgi:tRNA modification GTPase